MNLADTMRYETLEAGVKKERYDRITISKAQKYPDIVEDFLRRIHQSLFLEILTIRGYVTADMWAMYKITNSRSLKEVQLLHEAQYKLRVIWQRPSQEFCDILKHEKYNPLPFEYLFRKYKDGLKNKSESVVQQGDSVRPTEAGSDEANRGRQ